MGQRTGNRAVWRRRAGIGSAALVVALVATAPAALAQKRAPAPKPDLAVSHWAIRATGGEFVFQNERDPNLSVEDTTANVGRAKAGRSATKVYLEHGGRRWLLAKREVPALRPGERDPGSQLVVHLMDFPLGAYTVEICADADHQYREATRARQCARDGAGDFTVAAARWQGSISGEYDSVLGNMERWSSSNAQLVYDGYTHGIFTYALFGTVTWTDSGTDEDGCGWSGSGSSTFTRANQPVGAFVVDYKHEQYNGGFATAQHGYPITIACPDDTQSTNQGPEAPSIFASHLGSPTPLPFGSTTLPGSPSTPVVGLSVSWNLQPAAP
ncbi:MAG TPA: hypothetical protein VHW96_24830 [Solirubrobacteraceae bacterium]|jgi:hypothetical protein|nr:hypothetical protein [Solirubrobacteraceae bacterium]